MVAYWRTVRWVLGANLAVGCASAPSPVPLSNSEPSGPNTYFYGYARFPDQDSDDDGSAAKPPASPAVNPFSKAKPKPKPKAQLGEEAKAPKKEAADQATVEAKGPLDDAQRRVIGEKFEGEYRGTDTVDIRMPPLPTEPQVDDKARYRVGYEDDELRFTIIDSSNGNDLCVLVGEPKTATRVDFLLDQSCFEMLLGIPMDTSLSSGKATLKEGSLNVEFRLELSLETPDGTIEGTLDYTFEGKRE